MFKWLAWWTPQWLSEWRRRRALHRELDRLDRDYGQQVADEPARRMEIYQDWDYNTGWTRAALGELETRRLVRRAEKRGLEVPDDNTWWTHHAETDTKYLRPEARARVKRMIRNDFRESVKWWVDVLAPVLGALTGLIGALIGLLALWKQSP